MKRLSPRARTIEILARLQPLHGHLTTGLTYSTPFQLLVATILSAQCTDERVNKVTPALFARFPSPQAFVDASLDDIEAMIHSCGFFRSKAKNIQAASALLLARFGGEVPSSMQELIMLPGVARKTANVVLSHAFDRNEGIAVDTHVQRLAGRLGISQHEDPLKVERDLMRLAPKDQWGQVSDLLIWHGRKVCGARQPQCAACVLADLCPSAFNVARTIPTRQSVTGQLN
jgi:endonuclease-3